MHWGWKENPSSAAVQSADGFRRDAFPSMFDMSISMTWSSAEVNHGDIWWQSWIHVVEPCIVEPCGMQEFYGVLFVLGDLGDLGVPCKCELRTSENVHFVLSLVRILSFFRLRSDGGVWEPFTHVSRTCSWFDLISWNILNSHHHKSSSIIIYHYPLSCFAFVFPDFVPPVLVVPNPPFARLYWVPGWAATWGRVEDGRRSRFFGDGFWCCAWQHLATGKPGKLQCQETHHLEISWNLSSFQQGRIPGKKPVWCLKNFWDKSCVCPPGMGFLSSFIPRIPKMHRRFMFRPKRMWVFVFLYLLQLMIHSKTLNLLEQRCAMPCSLDVQYWCTVSYVVLSSSSSLTGWDIRQHSEDSRHLGRVGNPMGLCLTQPFQTQRGSAWRSE